jgi:hypothetical protein
MKTKIIKLSLSAILLCLCMTSCKKKVDEDYRPEFIGYWYCAPYPFTDDNSYIIYIDKNSDAIYQEFSYNNPPPYASDAIRTIKGKARATGKKLKIGRLATFMLTEYPHKIDTAKSGSVPIDNTWSIYKKANWEMTIKSSSWGPFCDGVYYKAYY